MPDGLKGAFGDRPGRASVQAEGVVGARAGVVDAGTSTSRPAAAVMRQRAIAEHEIDPLRAGRPDA